MQTTSPTSVRPVSPPITWLDTAAGVSLPTTATPVHIWIPDRIVIPAIQLDAPVIPAILKDSKTLKDIEYKEVMTDTDGYLIYAAKPKV
jgi:hypothetical protein